MKRFIPVLLIFISFFISVFTISVEAQTIIPYGSQWKYWDNDTRPANWEKTSFNDAAWPGGFAQLGYGDGDETTVVACAACNPKYITTYFRKTINIPDPSIYSSFTLNVKRDDGVVVYVNGTERYADNMPAGRTHATTASTACTDDGNTAQTTSLSSSFFIAGDNVIAVEIHQSSTTSSDITFDLELIAVAIPAGDVTLFPFGENLPGAPAWKYIGGGTNLDGLPWKDLGYAEPGWLTANSALGFGASPPARNTAIPENTSAGGGGNPGARYPTLYFRKTVNIANPSSFAGIKISTKFDDGIVVWVNGAEAYVNNIGSFPAYADWAPTAIAGNGSVVYNTTVPTSMFVAGNNIIAVEIHQNAATSSDLFFDMELVGLGSVAAVLTKGPYLQVGNETAVTIRWQTDVPTNSRVTYGTVFGTYTDTTNDAAFTTNHIVRITGLTPDTKYFYTIGSSTETLLAANNNYVLTLPPANTTRKLRFAAIGDCGNNSNNQRDSKTALLNYVGTGDLDAVITLGDNAYSSGLETEFQNNFFNVYQNDLLRNKKLYPTPGNHDYGNSNSNTGVRNNAYYNNFSLPTAGECGGLPSGTKAYYSFNVGDVHFISLDSYGREDGNTTKVYDTLGAQAIWVKNDLAANTKKWTVVYFHHPPYTKTSHDSDAESGDLGAMRENFIRILERNGVDLVLCGHSHGYERSYLLQNYYRANPGDPYVLETNFNFASHTATGNNQNAKYDGTANSCAYTYNSGRYNHGSVYVVAGSAGQLGGTSSGYPHNAMYYSNVSNGGTLYFEVDSNRLDAKFLSYSGTGAGVSPVIRDQFTIFKDVNRVYNINVPKDTPLDLVASWRGTYYWPINAGATTQAVTLSNNTAGVYSYVVQDAASNNCMQDVYNVTVFTPLPVTLLSFNATLNKDKVMLNWSTSQELNNKYFSIEKSTDGINFSLLGKQNAVGTSGVTNNYQMIDFTPAEGINYYRLSQTDNDGQVKNHGIKTVKYKSNADFTANILNNGNGQISVAIKSKKTSQINLRVIDMMGKEILNENFTTGNGGTIKSLNLNLGVFVLVLTNENGESVTNKIVVH
ncbi:MAG: metallophosphoesterase [Chitinophagaceae bacterium]|nr:metallophosphoesterase [Chitinophagaceae bacterium]